MSQIRIAVLGYGRSGSRLHADAIEQSDDFEMVAACDIDPERCKQAAERFGCNTYDDYHAMLGSEKLDMVSIVTRSDQHCEMTCDCLAAGVNVLVTKPWAVNADEARKMVEAARASGKLLFPWLPARWGAGFLRLKELVAEKAIGDVFLVRRSVCSFGTRSDWQTERRYGGGYLLNWGPHIVDPPVLLMGGDVKSVYGRLRQTINPGDVEDLFMAVITLADGSLVQAEYTVSLEDLPGWLLQGTRGTIVVRGDRVKIYRKEPDRPRDPTQFATMKPGETEISEETLTGSVYGDANQVYAELAMAVRQERPFPVKPEDALQLSIILDAVRTSSAEDRVVSLSEEGLT